MELARSLTAIVRFRTAGGRSLRNWSEAEILKSSLAFDCAEYLWVEGLIFAKVDFTVGEIKDDVEL